MTGRSHGAPDPAEPSHSGAATDLNEVRRTDAIIDALADRRAAGPTSRSGPDTDSDPAVRLLRALVTDVDDSGRQTAGPPPPGPGARRRGPRTIVALGVAGAVLASTGVAAAGGGLSEPSSAPAPSAAGVAEEAARSRAAAPDSDVATHEPSRSVRPPRPPAKAPVPEVRASEQLKHTPPEDTPPRAPRKPRPRLSPPSSVPSVQTEPPMGRPRHEEVQKRPIRHSGKRHHHNP